MKTPNFDTRTTLELHTLDMPGGRLRWWRGGQGRPLLVLNGGPGSPSLYLHPLVRHLGRFAEVFVFDQPGTGGSTVNELSASSVGIPAILAAAEQLREHLGFERWHVLGHSFGTMLGMQYACDHPTRVASLVLSGPGGPDTSFFPYFRDNVRVRLRREQRTRFNELLELSKQGRISADEESELDDLFMQASTFDPDYFENHAEDPEARINRATSEVVWASMREPAFDLKPRLPGIACPTVILVGRQDYIGEAAPLTIASLIPGSRIVWFNECGHKPWFEKLEEFDRELDAFYASVPA